MFKCIYCVHINITNNPFSYSTIRMYDGQSYKNIFSFTHLFDVEPIIIGVHETNTQGVNSVEAVYDISEPINQKCLC